MCKCLMPFVSGSVVDSTATCDYSALASCVQGVANKLLEDVLANPDNFTHEDICKYVHTHKKIPKHSRELQGSFIKHFWQSVFPCDYDFLSTVFSPQVSSVILLFSTPLFSIIINISIFHITISYQYCKTPIIRGVKFLRNRPTRQFMCL